MGFRFWRRIRVAPGVTVNLSKSGASLSLGPRGAKYTIGRRGSRVTAGLPGTGLFYTKVLSPPRGGEQTANGDGFQVQSALVDRLTPGPIRRLFMSPERLALVESFRHHVLGDDAAAFEAIRPATATADGAYLAGMLALQLGRLEDAREWFTDAERGADYLGVEFDRIGVAAAVRLRIIDELFAEVPPGFFAARLARIECSQALGDLTDAESLAREICEIAPDSPLATLTLADVLLERGSEGDLDEVIRIAVGTTNESAVEAALLLTRGRALARRGLSTAARDEFTAALRRRKDRPERLLNAIRFERAVVYEALGQRSRARSEFEKLYADDPEWPDVARRIGV